MQLNEELRRTLFRPYWVGNPLMWTTMAGIGIAFYALEGRVGMFNLSWLMLNVDRPPLPSTYHARREGLGWVTLHAEKLEIAGSTLEHQAAMLPLWAFCDALRHDKATYTSLALKCLLHNGLSKLEHDPRPQRTSR